MVAALEERGDVELRWGWRVDSSTARREHVDRLGAARRTAAAREPLRARYLVGCDGGAQRRARAPADPVRRLDVRAALARRRRAGRPPARAGRRTRTSSATRAGRSCRCRCRRAATAGSGCSIPGEDAGAVPRARRASASCSRRGSPTRRVEFERAVVYTFHARTRRALARRARAARRRRRARHAAVRRARASAPARATPATWRGSSRPSCAARRERAARQLRGRAPPARHEHAEPRRPLGRRRPDVAARASARLRDAYDRGARPHRRARLAPAARQAAADLRRGRVRDPARTGSRSAAPSDRCSRSPDRLDDRLGTGWAVVASTPGAASAWRARGSRASSADDPGSRTSASGRCCAPTGYVFACGGPTSCRRPLAALRRTVGAGLVSEAARGGGGMIAVLGATGHDRPARRRRARRARRRRARARARPGSRRRAAAGRPRPTCATRDRCAPRWTAPSSSSCSRPTDPTRTCVEAAAVDAAVAAGVAADREGLRRRPVARPQRRLQHRRRPLAQRAAHRGQRAELQLPAAVVPDAEPAGARAEGRRLLPAPMGDAPIAMVDARDVADCAVAALTEDAPPTAPGTSPGPAGVTFADVARHAGRPLRERAGAPGRPGAAPARRLAVRGRPRAAHGRATSRPAPTARPTGAVARARPATRPARSHDLLSSDPSERHLTMVTRMGHMALRVARPRRRRRLPARGASAWSRPNAPPAPRT